MGEESRERCFGGDQRSATGEPEAGIWDQGLDGEGRSRAVYKEKAPASESGRNTDVPRERMAGCTFLELWLRP